MDFMILIGWLVLGTVLFATVHKVLDFTYFSFSGVFSVWFGCMAAVAIGFYFAGSLVMYVVNLVVGFVTVYYKWIIGGVVALVILGIVGSKSNTEPEETEKIEGTENTNN